MDKTSLLVYLYYPLLQQRFVYLVKPELVHQGVGVKPTIFALLDEHVFRVFALAQLHNLAHLRVLLSQGIDGRIRIFRSIQHVCHALEGRDVGVRPACLRSVTLWAEQVV